MQVIAVQCFSSSIGQAEEVADGVEQGMGVLPRRVGGGRAEGGAGVVEELVLEPLRRVGDRSRLRLAQVGAARRRGLQLALADRRRRSRRAGGAGRRRGAGAGGPPGRRSVSRSMIDQGRVDPLLPPRRGSASAWPQVIDVVEHHLLEIADPRVEVAGDGDVEDQGQAIASGALDAGVLLVGRRSARRRRWC